MPIHSDIIERGRVTGWAIVALVTLLLAPLAHADGAEIHSNGRGGGLWSEPETWHGQRVPGPEDTVVIAMRDRVEFDRDDRDAVTCRALYLDPEAVLSFREGRHHRTLSVAGPIESYGSIRVDGTGDRRGVYEIRLVGEGPSESQRTMYLREHAGLLIYGHEQHRSGERNVRLTAASLDPDADRTPARIVADGHVMFDLHRAHVHDIQIELANLDNSGGSRERLNIIGNYFTGLSMLELEGCDTPVVRDNHFHADPDAAPEHAVRAVENTLAQLRGNTIEGPYNVGMFLGDDQSGSVTDTRIVDVALRGIDMHGVRGTSFENVHIRGREEGDAGFGVWLRRSSGVLLQAVRVEHAEHGFGLSISNAQLTDCSVADLITPEASEDEDEPVGVAVHLRDRHARVRLVNSPFEPDEIEIHSSAAQHHDEPYVETMQYVIVRVVPEDAAGEGQAQRQARGELDLPPGLQVRLQTAEESGGVPEGRADLNVRNSPVPVSRTSGLTPVPRSQRALAVRSWRYDREGEFRQAPFYQLIVEARTGDDGAYQTLVSRTIEPRAGWFQADSNRPEPTIEVRLP